MVASVRNGFEYNAMVMTENSGQKDQEDSFNFAVAAWLDEHAQNVVSVIIVAALFVLLMTSNDFSVNLFKSKEGVSAVVVQIGTLFDKLSYSLSVYSRHHQAQDRGSLSLGS